MFFFFSVANICPTILTFISCLPLAGSTTKLDTLYQWAPRAILLMLKLFKEFKKNESNGLCHATRNKVVLVLKEQLRTTWQAAQSNYFVCLSNMKATLSTDILQRWDKALKKGLEKLCLSHRRQWLGNLDISYLIKLFKSETIRPALMGLTFIYCTFCLPQ